MIKQPLKKLFQLLIMLIMAYSGTFLIVEEKTEKTEKFEEALHSINRSSGFQLIIYEKKKKVDRSSQSLKDFQQAFRLCFPEQPDYNINHIYLTSYLRLIF